jgi:hypothetical protein
MNEDEKTMTVDPETGEVLEPGNEAPDEGTEQAEPDEPNEEEAEEDAQDERDADLEAQQVDAADAPARDDADVERRAKALTRAATTYVKKVVESLGPDLDGAAPCPLCAEFYPGFRFQTMPNPENAAKVRVAIGLEPGDNLLSDGYSRVCEACDGWGFTDSGSKVAGQGRLTCYDCTGRGWLPVGDERSSGSVTGQHPSGLLPTGVANAANVTYAPEADKLKELGWIVVPPAAPVEAPNV